LFCILIEQWEGETLQLFVIPYGEALIHRYYREGIIQLASLPQVTGISCQTNLSFPADEWLNELRTAPALINKIKVWASFHPEMTSVEKFVRQLHTLMSLEPAIAALSGFVFLGEQLLWSQWLALSVIIMASIGCTYTAQKNRKAAV
jgi:hypothetical protein